VFFKIDNMTNTEKNIFDQLKWKIQTCLIESREMLERLRKDGKRDHNWTAADLMVYRNEKVMERPDYVVNELVKVAIEKKIDIVAPPIEEPKKKGGRPRKNPEDNKVIINSTSADFGQEQNRFHV
jgi:hypothetical protein